MPTNAAATIPTVRLAETDRAALAAHFLALEGEDRRLRFGSTMSDEALQRYVRGIDFEGDGVFAVHDERLRLAAVVHVAVTGAMAELGLSVLAGWRGKGNGNALLQRAVTFLRNRGVPSVYVRCLSENAAMMHLARRNGMRVSYSGSDSDAHLEIGAPDARSFIAEWLEDHRGGTVRDLLLDAQRACSHRPLR